MAARGDETAATAEALMHANSLSKAFRHAAEQAIPSVVVVRSETKAKKVASGRGQGQRQGQRHDYGVGVQQVHEVFETQQVDKHGSGRTGDHAHHWRRVERKDLSSHTKYRHQRAYFFFFFYFELMDTLCFLSKSCFRSYEIKISRKNSVSPCVLFIFDAATPNSGFQFCRA
jgi:hypothetical protein